MMDFLLNCFELELHGITQCLSIKFKMKYFLFIKQANVILIAALY